MPAIGPLPCWLLAAHVLPGDVVENPYGRRVVEVEHVTHVEAATLADCPLPDDAIVVLLEGRSPVGAPVTLRFRADSPLTLRSREHCWSS